MVITIRNVDDSIVAKLNSLAEKHNMSREAYLRKQLESMAVIGQLKELDEKYSVLVNNLSDIIQQNTLVMEKLEFYLQNQ